MLDEYVGLSIRDIWYTFPFGPFVLRYVHIMFHGVVVYDDLAQIRLTHYAFFRSELTEVSSK